MKMLIKKYVPKKDFKFEVSWKKMNVNALTFIYENALIRVNDTITDNQELKKRGYSLLGLLASLNSIMIAGMLSNFYGENSNFKTTVVLSVGIVIASVLKIYLVLIVRPKEFMPPGRVPNKIIVNSLFENPNLKSDDDTMRAIIYQELLNCQSKINMNQYYNTIRAKAIDNVLIIMSAAFVVLLLLLFLLTFS